ncbi:hypothetical protein GCM10009809_27000 [Isoptericola hypogeus]|uniref:Uncharacterized protein n=1 Tax=Isoptericola hypogeus TaxID=300179 RepID=A0ABN2JK68_9MICO
MNDDGRTTPDEVPGEVPGEEPDGLPGDAPDDAAFARLRAADPAADTRTRTGILRAKVDAQVGDELRAGALSDGAPAGDERPGDELARRRTRRRRTPWLAAAGVVAFAVVGAGGYALGSGSGAAADGDGGATAEPAVALHGGPQGGGQEESAGGAAADGAMGAAESGAASGDMALSSDVAYPSWYSSGRAVFHASGLSTEDGTARGYAFDATDAATRAGAARVAEALGVEGEPRWDYGSWSVGPRDGRGPTVWLSVDGSATFGFSDPAADPWQCADAAAGVAEDGAEDGAEDAPDDGVECPDATGTSTVSDREARRALSDAMEQVGVDPEGYELEVGEVAEDDPSRWVTAYQVVDGSRTGAQWSATVGEAGIAWLDGFLASTTDLGTYPVISAADAVERLGDPRFSGSVWPVVFAESTEAALEEHYEEPTDPTPPPTPPSAGDPVDWPVSDVEITSARLGLAQQYQDDGTVVMVPAYELSDAAGNAWSVVAVADEAMDFTAPPR